MMTKNEMVEKLKSWASKIKKQAKLLQIIYEDHRTPLSAKILIWITLGYLFSPIDLIPDFIPVLGLLDDVIIIPLLVLLILKMIPKQVIQDSQQKIALVEIQGWKQNKAIIILIALIWLGSAYLIYKLGIRYL